ncbi:hypothetical protein Hanom_Chr03g00243631 [Helianthus anomalus]
MLGFIIMINMIIAPVDTIIKVIFRNTSTRNDMLWFDWTFYSSNECWNSIGYPLSNNIFNILSSHVLIPWMLLRLINLIYWFITTICHLIIYNFFISI